jgi:hypothetical protein
VLPGKGYEEEYFAYSTVVQVEADGPVRLYAARLEDQGPVIADFMAGRKRPGIPYGQAHQAAHRCASHQALGVPI